MAPVAKIGHGVRFQRNTGDSPDSFEDLGELIEPGAPNLTRDAVEATHSLSTNRYREFIGGLRDGGEVALLIALEPSASASSNYAKLFADYENNDLVTYRTLFPNAAETSWEFTGLITGLEHALPIDDRMTVSVTVKVSGEPTLADH